jgi:prepilin-type N-terminal cleavage/methylation domain-containing protein
LRKRAFTLLDILIVIIILGVMAAITIQQLQPSNQGSGATSQPTTQPAK